MTTKSVWRTKNAGWFEHGFDGELIKVPLDDSRVTNAKAEGKTFFIGDDWPHSEAQVGEEVARLAEHLAEKEKELNQVTTGFASVTARATALNAELDTAKVTLANRDAATKALEDERDIARAQLAQALSDVKSFQTSIAGWIKTVQDGAAEHAKTLFELGGAKKEVEINKAFLNEKDAHIAELERDLNAARLAAKPSATGAWIGRHRLATGLSIALSVVALLFFAYTGINHLYTEIFAVDPAIELASVKTQLTQATTDLQKAANERDALQKTATEKEKQVATLTTERNTATEAASAAKVEADKANAKAIKLEQDAQAVSVPRVTTPAAFKLSSWDTYEPSEKLGLLIEQCSVDESIFGKDIKVTFSKLEPLKREDAVRILSSNCDPAELDKKHVDAADPDVAPPAPVAEKVGPPAPRAPQVVVQAGMKTLTIQHPLGTANEYRCFRDAQGITHRLRPGEEGNGWCN